jgi:hypothetical protein
VRLLQIDLFSQPSFEIPIMFSYDPAVWKYNMQSHLAVAYPTTFAILYASIFDIMQDEKTLLKGALLEK